MGIFSFLRLIGFIFICCSCLKQTENITPIAEPKTLAELQREAVVNMASNNQAFSTNSTQDILLSKDPTIFYLSVKYNISDMDVFATANIPNQFEQLAHSFLGSIAKIVLSANNPYNVDINNIVFKIPNLNLDYSIVKSIKIKRIFLQYSNAVDQASNYNADFSFIDTLDLNQVATIPKIGTVNNLLLSYDSHYNNCMNKCLDFSIMTDNLLDILKPNTEINLKPTLAIKGLPAVTNLTLDGYVEIQIGLKLPF